MSLLLDDLETGQEFTSLGRTVTESDIMTFAGLSGDFSRLHTNELWVKENTPFRGRIAHGLLVLSISSGLRTPGFDELEVIAYLESTRKFVAPTYPGDTIHARWTVLETRRSRSRPEAGIVRAGVEVRSQEGTVLQSGSDVYLVAAGTEPS